MRARTRMRAGCVPVVAGVRLELGLEKTGLVGSRGTTAPLWPILPYPGSGLQPTAGLQGAQRTFRGCLWSAGTGLNVSHILTITLGNKIPVFAKEGTKAQRG